MKILFLGPECPALTDFLTEKGHSIVCKEDALDLQFLADCQPDFGISYRYLHIVKKPVLDWFNGKLINMHISYLPWNRGGDPNIWSFLTQTPSGVTIHVMDEGLDTGPILVQQQVQHDLDADTLYSSYARLSNSIEKLFIDNADAILEGGGGGGVSPL